MLFTSIDGDLHFIYSGL